jgi:hypothetical protein
MRVEANFRAPQKIRDHRVAQIFRPARAFATKPHAHCAVAALGGQRAKLHHQRVKSPAKLNHQQG